MATEKQSAITGVFYIVHSSSNRKYYGHGGKADWGRIHKMTTIGVQIALGQARLG